MVKCRPRFLIASNRRRRFHNAWMPHSAESSCSLYTSNTWSALIHDVLPGSCSKSTSSSGIKVAVRSTVTALNVTLKCKHVYSYMCEEFIHRRASHVMGSWPRCRLWYIFSSRECAVDTQRILMSLVALSRNRDTNELSLFLWMVATLFLTATSRHGRSKIIWI